MSGNADLGRRAYLGTLAGALAAGVAGCNAAEKDPSTTPAGEQGAPADGAVGDTVTERPTAEGSAYTEVYRQIVDSVVLVQTASALGRGQGSGWVFREGYVVTNHHVVEGASAVRVRFDRGEWRDATVVGTDPYSDLAVLAVDDQPAYADALELVDRKVVIGQRVLAVGNPFGLEQSATAGIVSGTNRSIPATDDNPNDFVIPDAIQTDAASNPGNSGGPLVTLQGRVAGVINSGGGDNIAFAISAPLVGRVVPALVADGEYHHSFVGVRTVNVTPLVARANGLTESRGVLVVDVLDGTPADGVLRGSALRPFEGTDVPQGGDVVRAIDGTPIPTQQALSTHLALRTSPGDTIDVEVLRDGQRQTVELTLERRPPPR